VRQELVTGCRPLLIHKGLCVGVAVAVAHSLTHGRAAPGIAAALVVSAMVAIAWGKSPRSGARSTASSSRRPNFHQFLVRRLGSPRRPLHFLINCFVRPLTATSFAGFWRAWNPPLAYVLLFFIYRPLSRLVPRPVARYVAFLASGVLHDVVANGDDLLRGRVDPSGTVLFAILGMITLMTDAVGMDLSRRPAWARMAANLSLLTAGFALRHVVLAVTGYR
jgi:hypothetical protein